MTVMQSFAIPRTDPSGEGIHLLWTWPDVLPLSVGGYDIQRLDGGEDKWESRCEQIGRELIDYLARRGEYAAPLGPLRMTTGVRIQPGGPVGLTAFTQELTAPVERATVEVTGKFAVALALSQGKVTQVASATIFPATLLLQAPSIDTIVVYTAAAELVVICVYERPGEVKPGSDPEWDHAPYIAKGLTLPIKEADPALATPAQEYAAAHGRLLPGETLTAADFGQLAGTMRGPASEAVTGSALGRGGERVVLVRADDTQSYEELAFDNQLSGLVIDPKLRRVLGFGHRDNDKLIPGHSYRYRITGRFRAEDLTDTIYDVHRVPASTTLPAACSIRDLGLRFQKPVKVVLEPAPSATALVAESRRGIRIDTSGFDPSWWLASLEGWSAVLSLPRPVANVILEIAPGHSLSYAGGVPWAFGAAAGTPLPAGPVAHLTFASPITELRLAGTGTLFAVRLPSGQTGVREVHAYAGPVTYAAEPLPQPPTILTADNLQQPQTAITGPIDESTAVPPRPPNGFLLTWLPPTVGGLTGWPSDQDAGPPLDAIAYQVQHRAVTLPSGFGPWQPIASGDNLTVGSRDNSPAAVQLSFGCDLDAVFPAIRPRSPGAGFELHLSDVFGETDPVTGTVLRPAQPLGSYHQYEIVSVDAVGRVSATATLSNVVRLEKHIPPPLPVGPQPEPPVTDAGLTAPPGPRARAIVAGDPRLTAADIALLGAHHDAILLEWGWRQAERDLDPTTAEFRVYSTVPPDVVTGAITSVTSASTRWQLQLTTNVPLVANELAGQWITSNGYPFQVVQNDAGTAPGMLVDGSVLQPATQPVAGPVVFGRPLAPAHQSPAAWDQRVTVYPLTAADSYQHVFYDVLDLSVTHPRDGLWVGVTAADAQSYVPDQRTTGTLANRPGNESGVVACAVTARYRGQPVFSVPPPLGDVPELVTDEPTGRQVLVSLDLSALTGGALAPGTPCVLARCSAEDILSRTAVSGGQVVLTLPDGTADVITFANPGDEAAVLTTLNSDRPQDLANRYLLHLAVGASDPLALFTRLSDDILSAGPTDDQLAPKPGRYLYLVRAADALGHLSAGYAILPVVVRVPSTASAATPVKQSLATTDTAVTLTVSVTGADPDTTTVLLFAVIAPPDADPPVQGEAELLRIPNRRDLYPDDGLRLLLSDGTLLGPAVVKNLADADVTVEADGTRVAALTTAAAKGSWASLWCYGLTKDGLPSYACGPFGTGVRA